MSVDDKNLKIIDNYSSPVMHTTTLREQVPLVGCTGRVYTMFGWHNNTIDTRQSTRHSLWASVAGTARAKGRVEDTQGGTLSTPNLSTGG